MKRIISVSDKERIAKRNQLIIGLILISLMIFSTIGFSFSYGLNGNESEKIEYNGFAFVRDASTGYWITEYQGNEIYTVYNPEELEDIYFESNKDWRDYNGKPLYFVGEAGSNFAEFYRTMSLFVLRVGGACLDQSCEQDYPIKDCSLDNVVIIQKVSEEGVEEIVFEDNCVYIRAKSQNALKYVDAYLFDLLGIR